MRDLLIFDGDDTLWVTEPLYDDARSRAAQIVEAGGLDAMAWDALERSIDVANVARFGMSAERFPTSCVEALDAVAGEAGRSVPVELRTAVWDAGSSVFRSVAPLVDGAEDVLSALGGTFRLVLLTKGDERVQRKRIDESGLERHFELVRVVSTKDAGAFRHIRETSAVQPRRAWSIGNSLSSDVLPALEAGVEAIWIDAHVWEYERRVSQVPTGVWVADALRSVPSILDTAMATAGTA